MERSRILPNREQLKRFKFERSITRFGTLFLLPDAGVEVGQVVSAISKVDRKNTVYSTELKHQTGRNVQIIEKLVFKPNRYNLLMKVSSFLIRKIASLVSRLTSVEASNKAERARANTLDSQQYSQVVHEVTVNLEARRRYQDEFNEELPVEQPVGYLLGGIGVADFAIFRTIPHIVSRDDVPEDIFQEQGYWSDSMKERLESIGIVPYDGLETVVVENNGEYRFIIVDSADWRYVERSVN